MNKDGHEEGGADLKSIKPSKKKAPGAATDENHEEGGGAKSARGKSKLKAAAGEEGSEAVKKPKKEKAE